MAIYRLSAVLVKRSEGRSAVAAAAYRSGTRLDDRRSGKVFDYRRKRVLHRQILTPRAAPDWMKIRERLWNAVESAEKRKDSQLAREIQLALPHELDDEGRAELVRGFVEDQFVSRGMVADLALHPPDRAGDGRNFHAHVMLTLRAIEGEGFGPKQRDWNDEELLKQWRAAWSAEVNAALARAGVTARVDHRTLKAQGVNRVAHRQIGLAPVQMERRGVPTDRGDEIRASCERQMIPPPAFLPLEQPREIVLER